MRAAAGMLGVEHSWPVPDTRLDKVAKLKF